MRVAGDCERPVASTGRWRLAAGGVERPLASGLQCRVACRVKWLAVASGRCFLVAGVFQRPVLFEWPAASNGCGRLVGCIVERPEKFSFLVVSILVVTENPYSMRRLFV